MKKKVLAIIPARGGSKGVYRKNIRELNEKPLIYYTIKQAQESVNIDRIICSTDDEEIAEVAKKYGAEVPFIRPDDLAKDNTPDLPVVKHTISWLRENENYNPEIIVYLRPTCPLRSVEDIDGAIDKMINTNCDSVRSIIEVKHHPYWMKSLKDDKIFPFIEGKDEKKYYQRQLLPKVYCISGVVDVYKSEIIFEKDELFGDDIRAIIVPNERAIDIDTEMDFKIAELFLKNNNSRG